MDRAGGSNKKRAREPSTVADPSRKSGKKKVGIAPPPGVVVDPLLTDEADGMDTSSSSFLRPLSIFEFPWQKENLVIDGDGCDLWDVFFSSLVDGCKAAIGVPGDRLSPSPAPLSLPDEVDGGGADCIWSCVLREPLPLRYVQ